LAIEDSFVLNCNNEVKWCEISSCVKTHFDAFAVDKADSRGAAELTLPMQPLWCSAARMKIMGSIVIDVTAINELIVIAILQVFYIE
jgi:hypothetical protein